MERANPRDPQAAKKHYAVAHSDGEITLRQLAERIAEISTVSSIDTLAGRKDLRLMITPVGGQVVERKKRWEVKKADVRSQRTEGSRQKSEGR